MKGEIEKVWAVCCAVENCRLELQVDDLENIGGKAGAALAFGRERWSTRQGKWVCASHARLIPRGQKP